jgi:hypothetical protein
LYHEPGHARLVTALDRRGLPRKLVQVRPFVESVLFDGEPLPPCRCFGFGSYKLARLLRSQRAYAPGAYTDGLAVPNWVHWKDRLLNADGVVDFVQHAKWPEETDYVHVRPASDGKGFPGRVLSREEFEPWRAALLAGSGGFAASATPVVVSPTKTIYSETRCWVVDGRVVAASLYRRGRDIIYDDRVDPNVVASAAETAAIWSPNPAFVLDVADTVFGLRVIEANCLNAAGFYAADMGRLVDALANHLGA